MKDFFAKIGEIKEDCKDIFLKLFWGRKFSAFFIYGGILLNAISWIVLWQLTKLNQEIIILHYNAYLGIDLMLNATEGLYPDLFLVPVGGIGVLVLDIFLAGILLYLSTPIDIKDAEKHEESLASIDANLLGSNLIVVGGFLTQVAIFVYSLAILFVN